MGFKHFNPIGINKDKVKMSMRTQNDFDDVEKLKDAEY